MCFAERSDFGLNALLGRTDIKPQHPARDAQQDTEWTKKKRYQKWHLLEMLCETRSNQAADSDGAPERKIASKVRRVLTEESYRSERPNDR